MTPYVGLVYCWFSPLPRNFFSGYSGFPLSTKTKFSNSNSTRNGRCRTTVWMCYLYFYLRASQLLNERNDIHCHVNDLPKTPRNPKSLNLFGKLRKNDGNVPFHTWLRSWRSHQKSVGHRFVPMSQTEWKLSPFYDWIFFFKYFPIVV